MTTRTQELNALYRERLYYFIQKVFEELHPGEDFRDNWHIQTIAWHLEQCAVGNIRRLAIALPPRHLKSLCATIAYPAWLLGRDAANKIIAASYALPLSEEHARLFRMVVTSDWYKEIFPETQLLLGQNRALEQITTQNGYRRATSVGGSLTGMGAGTVILDDLMKPADADSEATRVRTNDWFDNTVISRLNNPSQDVIIAVMQRTHVDDFIGHIEEIGNWTILSIPATATEPAEYRIGDHPDDIYVREAGELIDPSRQDEENLAELRETMGERHFEAQYQQNPQPSDGHLIKRRWFRESPETFDDLPLDQVVIAWDTATGEGQETDYSVATVWRVSGYEFHLLYVYRERLQYPDLVNKAIELVEEYGADTVVVERAATGTPLVQELRGELGIRVLGVSPTGSKYARMSMQSVFIERGQVYLPRQAHWRGEFLNEVLAFPNARFDDQVDSMELFLRFMRGRKRLRPSGGRQDGSGGSSGESGRPGSASRRNMSRRNFRRHPGGRLPSGTRREDDDDEFIPTLSLGGL